jgi:hypothetical protein
LLAGACYDPRHAPKLFLAADAPMAPPYGYSEHVLLPVLRQHLGLQLDMRCLRHGAFPKAICDAHDAVHVHDPSLLQVKPAQVLKVLLWTVHRAGEWCRSRRCRCPQAAACRRCS